VRKCRVYKEGAELIATRIDIRHVVGNVEEKKSNCQMWVNHEEKEE
jgi:hypothetical protein